MTHFQPKSSIFSGLEEAPTFNKEKVFSAEADDPQDKVLELIKFRSLSQIKAYLWPDLTPELVGLAVYSFIYVPPPTSKPPYVFCLLYLCFVGCLFLIYSRSFVAMKFNFRYVFIFLIWYVQDFFFFLENWQAIPLKIEYLHLHLGIHMVVSLTLSKDFCHQTKYYWAKSYFHLRNAKVLLN